MKVTTKLILVLLIYCQFIKAEIIDESQALILKFNHDFYEVDKGMVFDGSLSIFVNCGSQYATWYQFPSSIAYLIKDLDTDIIYKSENSERSISHSGNRIYDIYSKKPCNQIVTKEFHVKLKDIYFSPSVTKVITNFELTAFYYNKKSNSLIFNDTPLNLKSW